MIPEAIELEKKILGTIMTFPEVMPDVVMILSADMFFGQINQAIYSGLIDSYEQGQSLDFLSTAQRHRTKKDVDLSYLSGLTNIVGTGSDIIQNCYTVKEKFIAREITAAAMKITALVSDPMNDVDDVLSESNNLIDNINEIAAGNSRSSHISTAVQKSLKEAENRQIRAKEGLSMGIPTGLIELDKILGGWQNSTLNIIAARPSMGKTALMLKLAKSAGIAQYPGCIYSLEMSDVSLTNRMLLSEADVDIERFKTGHMTTAEWKELEEASNSLSKLPIYIDDNPSVSLRYIKSHATVQHRKGKCQWIMIDYLQLAETEKSGTREQEISKASRAAKILAKELNIPVILLSQLSRAVEARADKKPNLSDLRESGAIEQDADTVIFIYRPAYYGIETATLRQTGATLNTSNFGQLIIAKQRDGATGSVNFLHNDSMTKIYDYDSLLHYKLLSNEKETQDPF